MRTKLVVTVLGIALLTACRKSDLSNDQSLPQSKDSTIVLFERASSKPFILSNKPAGRTMQTFDLPGTLDFRYYLGRAYDVTNGEFGTGDGVRFPIIDIDRLVADNPDYFMSKQLSYSEATRFSFSDFDRYQQKSNYSRKISGGFSLNLGLFKIGTKHKFDKAFSTDFIEDNKRVWGELNVTVRDASHELLMSTNTIKKIRDNYIRPSFIDELYNSPTSEIVKNYGGMVITGIVTGGKANALFTGNFLSTSNVQVEESSMDNSISASFTFKEKSSNSAGVEFGLGNSNGSTIALANNINEFRSTVKTYGGNYGISTFTVPKSIDDISIDLSAWAASMNDKTKHVLVDFVDDGLRPIGDFIRPENMKQNIIKYMTNQYMDPNFREPRIEARWIRVHNAYGLIEIVLRTRFGDNLTISNNRRTFPYGVNLDEVLNFAKQEALTKLPFYKVKVIATSVIIGAPNEQDNFLNVNANYASSIVTIDEANMTKFYDTKNGMLYLLSQVVQADGKKFAYAIHDDYVLDTYAIRDWVNAMQTSTIQLDELDGYTIVAL